MPKTDIDSEIRERVEAFVGDLTDLIRAAALEAVHEALSGGAAAPGAPRAKAKRAAKKTVRRAASKRKSGKRVRRSSEEVERIGARIAAHVKSNPGQRLGEIASSLNLATKDARRPAFALVASGDLRTEGQRGGTRYYPAGGGATRKAAKKTAKRKTKRKAKRKTKRGKK